MSKKKAQDPACYFDERAATYKEDVLQDPFLYYFHIQRFEAALGSRSLLGKRILDVGCGPGLLFDYLQKKGGSFDYWACDVSAQMLENSRIPKHKRCVGIAQECYQKAAGFDAIFLLGLSTYLSAKELENLILFCRQKLNPGGFVAVSFTHRKSLDYQLRQFVKRLLPASWLGRGILGSQLQTQAYSLKEIKEKPWPFQISEVDWLNQTIPGINRLLPRLSVALARVRKQILPRFILPWFSSDFLLILRRED
ncbi:MAG: class I SAM-dependent methyltransferase [Bacteroidetes bacterium]|nr:class I SAM-dependent methyltransferase [Bacteroidota bacterium]